VDASLPLVPQCINARKARQKTSRLLRTKWLAARVLLSPQAQAACCLQEAWPGLAAPAALPSSRPAASLSQHGDELR
jgi:hypothetical protein